MSGLKLWQSSAGIVLAISFWLGALKLPRHSTPWPPYVFWLVMAVAVAVLVGGAWVLRKGWRMPSDAQTRGEWVFAGVVLVAAAVLTFAVGHTLSNGFSIEPGQKFALGVGGAALGGFVFAATQYGPGRAAASVPVVVLLIGAATWPDASGFMDADVRTSVITWMGVILGVNGVAEAGKQVGEAVVTTRGERSRERPSAEPE